MTMFDKAFLRDVFQKGYINIIGDATEDRPWELIDPSWLERNSITSDPYGKDVYWFIGMASDEADDDTVFAKYMMPLAEKFANRFSEDQGLLKECNRLSNEKDYEDIETNTDTFIGTIFDVHFNDPLSSQQYPCLENVYKYLKKAYTALMQDTLLYDKELTKKKHTKYQDKQYVLKTINSVKMTLGIKEGAHYSKAIMDMINERYNELNNKFDSFEDQQLASMITDCMVENRTLSGEKIYNLLKDQGDLDKLA